MQLQRPPNCRGPQDAAIRLPHISRPSHVAVWRSCLCRVPNWQEAVKGVSVKGSICVVVSYRNIEMGGGVALPPLFTCGIVVGKKKSNRANQKAERE